MLKEEETNTYIPFNEDFCNNLECLLGKAFENSEIKELNSFWCDGVLHLPSPLWQLNKKHVNDTRKIITTAWIGKDGQDEYEMTIHFGKYSLRRYAKGSELSDCIPDLNSSDWVNIDIQKKLISINLK